MAHLIADPVRSARLVLSLRRLGITDDSVLAAIETIDRGAFVAPQLNDLSLEDCSLPIPCGQTLLRPLITASLLRALKLSPGKDQRLLLIGSGSGYTAALLSQMCRHVYGIERFQGLVNFSQKRLADLGVENVTLRHGDGLMGWADRGPFERILMTGAISARPQKLIEQLTPEGLLVTPVNASDGQQNLCVYTQAGLALQEAMLEPVATLIEKPAVSL